MLEDRAYWLSERAVRTAELEKSPYNADAYLHRAFCYEKLGYFDLVAADAYKVLLLTDEALDEVGEYHEEVVEAFLEELRPKGLIVQADNGEYDAYTNGTCDTVAPDRGYFWDEESPASAWTLGEWIAAVAEDKARHSYKILARTLLECGDLKGAFSFAERGLKVFRESAQLRELQEKILEEHCQSELQKDPAWDPSHFTPKEDLPDNGFARREIYSWNKYEPDRFSQENFNFLNAEIKQFAPKCEIHAVELPLLSKQETNPSAHAPAVKQLGIFASSDIFAHETVLLEPSVLTASTRLLDPFCDACSSRLPPESLTSPLPTCPSCDDIVFCSEACLERAQSLYHPAICGVHDFDIIAKDPSPFAATNALYVLLVARTIAMAQTQDVHPLDLPQIKYLWGDFTPPNAPIERTLPFSFENNIAQPLHLLSKLDLDPFAPPTSARYDTWVINTLLAKFRGVANASMNEHTGMPEVAGVHWLWALANHSCAPNVHWKWEKGGMGMVARGGAEVIRWGEGKDVKDQRWSGGIKTGEEVLNHYCDVELPVKERREWAVGALGGVCICRRCLYEAG